MREYPSNKYTKAQREWCEKYEHQTTFEPLMDDYEAGKKTFHESAMTSVHWFESWSNDAFLSISSNVPGWEKAAGIDAV